MSPVARRLLACVPVHGGISQEELMARSGVNGAAFRDGLLELQRRGFVARSLFGAIHLVGGGGFRGLPPIAEGQPAPRVVGTEEDEA